MPSSRGTDDNPNQRQEMVGLGKQKKISDVWTVFEKLKDEDGNVLAKCSLCGELSDGSSKKGTTHLRNHIRTCQRKRIGGGASGSGDKPAGNSVTDQQLNHLDRVRTCIKDKNVLSDLSSYDDNPNQTHPNQEISRIRKQNVVKETVGLVIQKKISDVWTVFERLKDKDGNVLAKCSLCGKLSDGSSKKGTTHLRNHIRTCQGQRNEGGATGRGDKPAGNSVTDQQLNHLDSVKTHIKQQYQTCPNKVIVSQRKRNGGGASGSRDKPAGNSVTDQQLNHLDRVKMLLKDCNWDLLYQIGDNDDIIKVYNEEKEKLRIYFEKLCCHFSLKIINMLDGKYTSFMVHFIDDDWKLEEKIIGFKCIEGDQNMKVLKNVLSDLGIDNKISSMVTDGDSDLYFLSSDERENRLSFQGSLLSNCKFCVRNFRDIERTCTNFEEDMRSVLRYHMRKFFKYIIETSSKIGTIQMALAKEVLGTFQMALGKEVTITEKVLEDMFWFDLPKIALGLKEKIFELENMDLHFKSINLTKEQWDVITKYVRFCDEDFEEVDWELFDRKTANIYFPKLCIMYKKSRVFVTSCNTFNFGKKYLQFVRDAEKCWDKSNLILAVAAVLDPRFKMDTVEHWYKEIYGDKWETQRATFMNYLICVYNEYANGTNNSQSSTSGAREKKSSISSRMLRISGNSYDHDSGRSNNFELYQYLERVKFPPIEEFDVLKWWRLHSRYFPTLTKMARDFLSIRITIPSYIRRGIFNNRNIDSDSVKEAFVCARSWLRN